LLDSSLSSVWKRRLFGVQDSRKISYDDHGSAGKGHSCGNLDVYLNVTKAISFPPIHNIVPGPDDWIDDVYEVYDGEPGNHTGSTYIAISDMPNQRRYLQDESGEGENREDISDWVNRILDIGVHDRLGRMIS
jgi:hypothetical protein